MGGGHHGIAGILKCYMWDSKHQLWGLMVVSIYNLLFINLERWFCLAYPFKHKVYIKKKHVITTCVVIWVLSLGFNSAKWMSTTQIIGDGICGYYTKWPKDPFWLKFVHWVTSFIWFFIPMAVLLFTNISILVLIKRRNAAWAAKKGKENSRPNHEKSKKKDVDEKQRQLEMNILKTLVTVNAAFFLCWVWNAIWAIAWIANTKFGTTNRVYYDFSVMMGFINSILNPFLYSASYKQFQAQSKRLFCKCWASEQRGMEGSRSNVTSMTSMSTIS